MERHLDPPVTDHPPAETRDETVERVIGDEPQSTRVAVDPSSRRRVGSRMSATAIGVAVAAAIMVLVIVLLASGGTGLALGLGGAAGLGAGIIAALVVAEREDGRIEREVDDDGAPRTRDV
jgi:hypothetical protein